MFLCTCKHATLGDFASLYTNQYLFMVFLLHSLLSNYGCRLGWLENELLLQMSPHIQFWAVWDRTSGWYTHFVFFNKDIQSAQICRLTRFWICQFISIIRFTALMICVGLLCTFGSFSLLNSAHLANAFLNSSVWKLQSGVPNTCPNEYPCSSNDKCGLLHLNMHRKTQCPCSASSQKNLTLRSFSSICNTIIGSSSDPSYMLKF